jgi:hypothetical protein
VHRVGLSRKNYNKVFAQQLKKLIDGKLDATTFRSALSSLTGDASRWPGDEEFKRQWLTGSAYPGRLDAAKLRAVFHRLETALRSEKSEERVPLDLDALDIDHVIPQSWNAHWRLGDGSQVTVDEANAAAMKRFAADELDAKTTAILEREDAVPRLGNLTLVHYGVNRSMQNASFSVKREKFFEHSNLHLNRQLMVRASWDELAVAARGEELALVALKIWPGPA